MYQAFRQGLLDEASTEVTGGIQLMYGMVERVQDNLFPADVLVSGEDGCGLDEPSWDWKLKSWQMVFLDGGLRIVIFPTKWLKSPKDHF